MGEDLYMCNTWKDILRRYIDGVEDKKFVPRETSINNDDILNIRITLETSKDVNDFIAVI